MLIVNSIRKLLICGVDKVVGSLLATMLKTLLKASSGSNMIAYKQPWI